MTFFFLLNPKSHRLTGDPKAGFQFRYEDIETSPPIKKLKKRDAKRLDAKVNRISEVRESFTKELQKQILDFQALSDAIRLLDQKILDFQMELRTRAEAEQLAKHKAQQLILEVQKQAIARLILEMEEEEYLMTMLLMDDD
jgi:hypothetical protein